MKNTKDELIREVNRRFNELEKDAARKISQTSTNIDDDLYSVEEKLDLLDSIWCNTKSATVTHEDVANRLETVRDIENEIKSNLLGQKHYHYLTFENENTAEYLKKLCGEVKIKDKQLMLCKGKHA